MLVKACSFSGSSPRGFTILELLIALVVAAILITVATPAFQEIFKRNAIAGQNNELVALIHLARNEAIRRNPVGNQTVNVEFTRDLSTNTWAGFVRPPGNDETATGCPTGAIRCSTHRRAQMQSEDWSTGAFIVRFDNRGYSVQADGVSLADEIDLFLVHESCTTDRHARRIRVLPAGQVSSDAESCTPLD
jgi:type IV fimbrial biogenesis protein FimT